MSRHSESAQLSQGYFRGRGRFLGCRRRRAEESKSPNEKVRFACIGVDGKGDSDSADAGRHGDVVAICDIDDNKLAKAGEAFPNARQFNDFRKLLEAMGPSIDAVTVSTPDHCHAAASIMAMKMGKACFTQKPLTHSIYEARRMAEVAREMKVATQMGNQGTAGRSLREQAAIVKAGTLGTVKEVHVWTNRPIWPQGEGRPPEVEVPKHVHWDLWIGPAPYRSYANGYHPFAWRGFWDFGTGALGDMACHTMNMPYMALDLQNPVSVEAETSGHNKETYPNWSIIKYEFPATDKRPAVTMTWYDGKKLPPENLFDGEKVNESGALLIGDKGKLYSPGDYAEKGPKLLGGIEKPEVEFEALAGPLPGIYSCDQGGQAGHVEFRGLLRAAHRDRAPGQPGGVERQEGRVGRQEFDRH